MFVFEYIDAGTGSYVLAALASGVAGLYFYFRSMIARIKMRGTDPAPTGDERPPDAS